MRVRRVFRALLTFFLYLYVLQECLKSKVARQLKFISKLYKGTMEFYDQFLHAMAGKTPRVKLQKKSSSPIKQMKRAKTKVTKITDSVLKSLNMQPEKGPK